MEKQLDAGGEYFLRVTLPRLESPIAYSRSCTTFLEKNRARCLPAVKIHVQELNVSTTCTNVGLMQSLVSCFKCVILLYTQEKKRKNNESFSTRNNMNRSDRRIYLFMHTCNKHIVVIEKTNSKTYCIKDVGCVSKQDVSMHLPFVDILHVNHPLARLTDSGKDSTINIHMSEL